MKLKLRVLLRLLLISAIKKLWECNIIGPSATELISEVVVAMNLECTADELAACKTTGTVPTVLLFDGTLGIIYKECFFMPRT